MSTLYNRVLGAGVYGYMGTPETRSQRILWPLRGNHGDTLPRKQHPDSRRDGQPTARALCEALCGSQSDFAPGRAQTWGNRPTAPHRAQRPRTAHRGGTGTQINTGTAHGMGRTDSPAESHRTPHRGHTDSQNAQSHETRKTGTPIHRKSKKCQHCKKPLTGTPIRAYTRLS